MINVLNKQKKVNGNWEISKAYISQLSLTIFSLLSSVPNVQLLTNSLFLKQ